MQNNTIFEDSVPNSIIVLEETSSTNDYLKQLLSKFKPLPAFTAIMTKHQTAGKGQRGNTWNSTANQNLTASFLISPHNLAIQHQFLLTLIASLSVYDIVQQYSDDKQVKIKWPNDVMVNNKKIAGILIENKIVGMNINHSIVGIGINIYQDNFTTDLKNKSTSLILENRKLNIEILSLVEELQNRLAYYASLANESVDNLLKSYNEKLFYRNTKKRFIFDTQEVEGEIIGVEWDGLLQIVINNELKKIDLKGISYIR